MIEQWRDIIGYEGLYQVSDLGRVRSTDRIVPCGRNGSKKLHGQIITSSLSAGYLAVTLSKESVVRTIRVHKLVLETWVGPGPNGYECCHGPAGRLDNSVSNLQWGSPEENEQDKSRDGTAHYRRVRRSDGAEFDNMMEAARQSDCFAQNIRKACSGEYTQTAGYGWEYCDD